MICDIGDIDICGDIRTIRNGGIEHGASPRKEGF